MAAVTRSALGSCIRIGAQKFCSEAQVGGAEVRWTGSLVSSVMPSFSTFVSSSPRTTVGTLETPGEMGHHALAKVVHAEGSHTIFDLFSQPKVVEGLRSSPLQTWAHYTQGATRGRGPDQ